MAYVLFDNFFPKIAERETRGITVYGSKHWGLPPGTYALGEMFCDEPGCDCRRVFFAVAYDRTKRMEAVVAYGWETKEYYAKWMGGADSSGVIEEMSGLSLNPGSPQSKLAPGILEMVRYVLEDEAYVERVKKHYQMVRRKVDKKRTASKRKKKKRRV